MAILAPQLVATVVAGATFRRILIPFTVLAAMRAILTLGQEQKSCMRSL